MDTNKAIQSIDGDKKIDKHDDLRSELMKNIRKMCVNYHPDYLVKEALEEARKAVGSKQFKLMPESALYKAFFLDEFHNGVLLISGFPEYERTFVVDLSRQLQEEYKCDTTSKKITAELVVQSYFRIMDIQRRINSYLDKGSVTELGSQYLSILSKDMERAQRHYYNAIQTLEAMNHPQLNLTVNAKQANIGQNIVAQQKE